MPFPKQSTFLSQVNDHMLIINFGGNRKKKKKITHPFTAPGITAAQVKHFQMNNLKMVTQLNKNLTNLNKKETLWKITYQTKEV